MIKIKIYTVGKSRKSWIREGIAHYLSRLKQHSKIDWIICKDDRKLWNNLEKEKSWIAFDPKGSLYSSSQLTTILEEMTQRSQSPIVFVIGGPFGLEKTILENAKKVLSLSNLTFTSDFARLIVLEQLYRGFQILAKTPYHK